MGIVKENLLTKGFSGGIGEEIVFRQFKNRTFFQKRPRKRSVITPDMQAARDRFQKAVYFAKTVLLDPAIREDYKKRAAEAQLGSAYVAAMTDFLKELKIAKVHTDEYRGNAGDPIYVSAVDDFKIQSLAVTIHAADGSVLETGEALRDENGWRYMATQANATRAGSKVVVVAKDRPGRVVTEEVIL